MNSNTAIKRKDLLKRSLALASAATSGLPMADVSSVRIAHVAEDVVVLSKDVME